MAGRRAGAFSLVEVLVVIGIVAVLSGLLLPVLAQARKAGMQATSISNLRQCGLALLMYCDENGGVRTPPNLGQARALLSTAPTCDPADYWRDGCGEPVPAPQVGSYGYVPDIVATVDGQMPPEHHYDFLASWSNYLDRPGATYWLVSPYYGSSQSCRFFDGIPGGPGWETWFAACVGKDSGSPDPGRERMADRLVRLRLDGSVQSEATPGGNWSATWLEAVVL